MDGRSSGSESNLESKSSARRPRRTNRLWWLILAGLIVWNVILLWPRNLRQAEINYTAFLDQVRRGNVTWVTIGESAIQGEFKAPTTLSASDLAGAASAAGQPVPQPSQTTGPYVSFRTVFPQAVGDPNLLPLLEANQVTIDAQAPSTPWFAVALTDGLPFLLMLGLLAWMGRQAARSQSGILSFGQSKARRYGERLVDVTFNDVAGADEAKQDLQEIVDFLKAPQKYHDLGARIPRGVLLVGPPGTGKTLMARAVAGEAGVPFFNLSASEFVEMFVGVGASRVRDLFKQAKEAAPAIVFIDELDAVGRRRGAGLGTVNDEREQTLNQLLVEMDGFDERHEVIMLGATNRPDVLDPALLRPGRFDRRVVVGLPDRAGREGILRIHSRGLLLGKDVDLGLLARTTTGFNGADLANLCNEAALIAARRDHSGVKMADFEEAVDKVLLGGVRPLLLDAHERRVVAYHEAGHALVAWFTPDADPVHKVTIIPRGQALGVTEQLPGEDHYNYSRSYLLARLVVMLGGRTAEELSLGDITTGAENDLIEATRLARRMVSRWAMGTLQPMAYSLDEEQPFLGYQLAQVRDFSEATAARIDRDVEDLLRERQEAARALLQDHRQALDELAEALLQEETIGREELSRLLGQGMQASPRSEPGPGPITVTSDSEPRETKG
jgi:cell division protease FtsH